MGGGGRQPPRWGASLLLGQIFPKSAWKWKKIGPEGSHASLAPLLDPPIILKEIKHFSQIDSNFLCNLSLFYQWKILITMSNYIDWWHYKREFLYFMPLFLQDISTMCCIRISCSWQGKSTMIFNTVGKEIPVSHQNNYKQHAVHTGRIHIKVLTPLLFTFSLFSNFQWHKMKF